MIGLSDVDHIAAAGLHAQTARLQTIAQNVANADSTGKTPGSDPYRRKLVVFGDVMDRELGFPTVQVTKQAYDMSPFNKKYDPGHPAADGQGYVLMPNVNPALEMTDMRQARAAYEANLSVVSTTSSMEQKTLSIIS